jgi:hypothetical protein
VPSGQWLGSHLYDLLYADIAARYVLRGKRNRTVWRIAVSSEKSNDYRFLIGIYVIADVIRNDLIYKKASIGIVIEIGQQPRSLHS